MMKNINKGILVLSLFILSKSMTAQGTWIPLASPTPVVNGGVMVMLLLSDGTVMAKTDSCRSDTFATSTWARLTPDANGSYVNGTWTTMTPMHDTRVYFASRVLKDGRVFVAGGEIENEAPGGNGTGGYSGETYDPVTDTWTMAPSQPLYFGDANSEILPNGKVLVAVLDGNGKQTKIFDPVANSWAPGPQCLHMHDESVWMKLADNSVLYVDLGSTTSERYIPSLNQWVNDATVPVSLYDQYWYETGAAFLLPDGRAFFLGSTGHTAYYTPSGNNSPGSWSAGPDIPNGYGTVDAPGAMMMNGKILCCASPQNISSNISGAFLSPTEFFEFDYVTNSFTQITAPAGGDSLNVPCYMTNMLDLPDGSVLVSTQNSSQCYVYVPNGSPLASGKPTINAVVPQNCDTMMITGTLFNGISEGACYGDDWQMASNYPIVRFTSGSNVYYARTFNWNSTGLQRGSAPDTTYFTLPVGLPLGSYSIAVIANGISSDTMTYLNQPCTVGIVDNKEGDELSVYPNPVSNVLHVTGISGRTVIRLYNSLGELVLEREVESDIVIDVGQLVPGVYTMTAMNGKGRSFRKIIVAK